MTKQRIYYTTSDNGDGSSSVGFFYDKKCIELLEEHDPETYGMGEGGGWFDVEGTITGIHIQTLDEVKAELEIVDYE